MGKRERKCNWRPLICLGLRALMKPLLPGCHPLLLPPQRFASSAAQGKAGGASSGVKAAESRSPAWQKGQESREPAWLSFGKGAWSSYSSASVVSCHAALASRGSPRLGAAVGIIPRMCLKAYLLVLVGRERATLF